jgi:hypothetical protein
VNCLLDAPEAIAKLEGIVMPAPDAEKRSEATNPADGAAFVRLTVHNADPGALIVEGLQLRAERVAAAVGATLSESLLVKPNAVAVT